MWGGMMPIGSSSMPSPSAAAIRGREDVAIGDVGWEDAHRQEGRKQRAAMGRRMQWIGLWLTAGQEEGNYMQEERVGHTHGAGGHGERL